ncbi:MAG: YafY family transcriptional regulator [Ignavibacteriae bacterium]|nr:YafY family transcriptional regulator [Ignavibacteriota bacterium]
MSKLVRYLGIILHLQSKKIVRAEDIAGHFGVSVRTVYRDLRALEEAGVPIAAEVGIGYSLAQGYYLPPVMFTEEEASALFLGGEFLKQTTDISHHKHTVSAIMKISSILPRDKKEYLERLQESVAIHARSPWLHDELSSNILEMIQKSIVHRNVLNLQYYAQSNDKITEREVEPLGLVYYSDHWHLVAYCRLRKDYRDFRADRIKSICVEGGAFTTRPNFSVKKFMRRELQMENPVEVRLLFSHSYSRFATSKYYYGLVEEAHREDGIAMTFLVPYLEWIMRWTLSFGRNVTVIDPPELRKMLAQAAREVAEMNEV